LTAQLDELARSLIAADTVSRNPSEAAMAALAARVADLGFETRLQTWTEGGASKANLVAWAGPPEPGGLILSGHLDVVPFADQPGWTRDPLHLEIGDERVYGRGTTDMKVFLAQCVEAARTLPLDRLLRPLVLLFTSDEEIGCLGAGRLAPALPELLGDVPVPALAWIGEPTSWRVFHAHKGVAGFEVTVRGEGGHSSVPEAGVNAIGVAARALTAIGELQAERRRNASSAFASLYPEAPYTTVNFGTISGGSASNMIADHCRFSVSYRPLPDEDPRAFYAEAVARLADIDAREWGSERVARLEVSEPLVAPGLLASRGTPLEDALVGVLGTDAGAGAPFCTDAGPLVSAGIDSLICGPGELDQAHQPDESIARRAYEEGPEHIRQVVARLCGGVA
jgi:acetylornithine deacetylase